MKFLWLNISEYFYGSHNFKLILNKSLYHENLFIAKEFEEWVHLTTDLMKQAWKLVNINVKRITKETSVVELISASVVKTCLPQGVMKGSHYLYSALPPFVSVTRSTLQHSSSKRGRTHRRSIIGTPRIYRKGVFVLLPGCQHWLRTCSAFLKSCHPCYQYRLYCRSFRPSASSSNLGSFLRRRNHHGKDRRRDPLSYVLPRAIVKNS